METTEKTMEIMESYVDRIGLDGLLGLVAEICYRKAESVRECYGPKPERVWKRKAQKIEALMVKIEK